MSYIGHITGGVRVANRNWPLVIVQLVMNVVSVVSFLLLVMLPTIISAVSSGVNSDTLVKEVERPENFDISVIPFPVVAVFLVALCFYLLVVMVIWIFVYGGAAGSVRRSFSAPEHKFSLDFFFSEGRRLFTPVVWLTALTGLVLLGATIAFAALMVPAALLGGASTGMYLLKGVLLLVPVVVFLAGLFLTVAFMFYGTAVLLFDERGARKAFGRTFHILWHSPDALCMISLLVLGYLLAVMLFSASFLIFRSTPLAGALGLPFQIVFSAFQAYLNVVMLASIFSYYKVTYHEVTGGSSTPASGTSPEAGLPNDPPQAGSAPPE